MSGKVPEKEPQLKQSVREPRDLENVEKFQGEDVIDQCQEFVPSIDATLHKEVAQRLIVRVQTATEQLSEEIELAKEKVAFLQLLDVQMLRADVEKRVGEFNFDNETTQIRVLTEIYESEDPYANVRSKFLDGKPEFERENQRLEAFQGEFGAVKNFVSKFWKKSEHENNVKSAQRIAKEITQQQLIKHIVAIGDRVETAKKELLSPEHNRADLLRRYSLAESDDTEAAAEALQKAADFYSQITGHEGVLDNLVPFLESLREGNAGESGFYFGAALSSVNSYRETLRSSANIFESERKSTSGTTRLKRRADDLKGDIRRLFVEPNPRGGVADVHHETEEWSITKEFLGAVKNFNGHIRQAEQLTHLTIGESEIYWTRQVIEAEKISSGRLLTHGAPTAMMYQILERGDLSSVIEQGRKHNDTNRTHIREHQKGLEDTETHDICFEVDSVYGNFSSDEDRIKSAGKTAVDMVLLFSENQLLDKRQFVDLDGRHIFDEKYSGDTAESPGFSVDLQQTPFMILVTEAEKDTLLDFLRDKSVFSDALRGMSPEEIQSWTDSHLIVTPSIDNFKFDQEVKKKFFESTKLSPKNGYVELTDTVAGFKVTKEKTKRFFAQTT